MTEEIPPRLLIEEQSVDNNYLQRIQELEAELTELKQAISDLRDRVTALGG